MYVVVGYGLCQVQNGYLRPVGETTSILYANSDNPDKSARPRKPETNASFYNSNMEIFTLYCLLLTF